MENFPKARCHLNSTQENWSNHMVDTICKKVIHFLGVDVQTDTLRPLLRALQRKKDILAFESQGAYREDARYTKVFVDTTMTESEFETWLFGLGTAGDPRYHRSPPKEVCIVGTFTRKNYTKSEGYLFDKFEAVPLSDYSKKLK